MTLSLFDQFQSATAFFTPLTIITLSLPWIFFPHETNHWIDSRLTSLQDWFMSNFTQQIFLPINTTGQKWALLLMSLMLFLITLNTTGILPYTFTPTTQLSMNMGFAVPIWLATVILGMKTQPTIVIAHFLPEGTPKLLIPILIIIETISLFIRPIALGVRLTANLTAGHLLIQLVSSATMALLTISPVTAMLNLILLFLLTLLEVAVAMIQAYVFVLLLSLYLQENV